MELRHYRILAKGTLLSTSPIMGDPNDPVVPDWDLHSLGITFDRIVCNFNVENMEFIVSVLASPENHDSIVLNTDATLFMPLSINKTTLVANGIDSVIISELPNTCDVWVNDNKYTITDGIFEFTIDTPGSYTIRCYVYPLYNVYYEFEVTAT